MYIFLKAEAFSRIELNL